MVIIMIIINTNVLHGAKSCRQTSWPKWLKQALFSPSIWLFFFMCVDSNHGRSIIK